MPVPHHPGNDELVFVSFHDCTEGLAENGRIFHFTVHAAGRFHRGVFALEGFPLFVDVHLEYRFVQNQHQDYADDTNRICHGIGGCEPCGRVSRASGGNSLRNKHIGECLLGSTKAGSVGDGSGHYAHHGVETLACKVVYEYGHSACHQNHSYCKEVHGDSALLEGMEETGAYLQPYRENEQDEAEVLHEGERCGVGAEAEVAENDAYEQDPGGTYGDTLDFETPQEESEGDYDCKEQYCMGNACTGE